MKESYLVFKYIFTDFRLSFLDEFEPEGFFLTLLNSQLLVGGEERVHKLRELLHENVG